MAKNNKEILSSLNNINEHTGNIENEVKKFGPKLPSGNTNNQDQINEAQLNTFTALTGLLGVLFGENVNETNFKEYINKSTNKDNNPFLKFFDDDLGYLNKKDFQDAIGDDNKGIIGKLTSINTTLDAIKQHLIKGPEDDNHNNAIKNVLSIDLDATNIEQLNAFFKELQQFDIQETTLNTLKSLSEIIKLIDTLDKIKIPDTEKISKSINKLLKILSNKHIKENFKDLLGDLSEIVSDVKGKNIDKNIISINNLLDQIFKIGDIGLKNQLKMKINIKFFKLFVMNDIKKLVDSMKDMFNTFDGDQKELQSKIDNLEDIIYTILSIGNDRDYDKVLDNIDILTYEIVPNIQNLLSNLNVFKSFGENFIKSDGWTSLQKDLINLDNFYITINHIVLDIEKCLDDIVYLLDTLDELEKISNRLVIIGKASKPISAGIDVLIYMINTINDKLVTVINKIDFDKTKIDNLKYGVYSLLEVMAVMAGSLFAIGFLVSKLPLKNILGFSILYGIFITSLITTIKWSSKHVQEILAKDTLEGLTQIVAVSGMLLIMGALTMQYIDIASPTLFIGLLALFIWGITKVYEKSYKNIHAINEGLDDFIKIVTVSSLVLILGSLAYKLIEGDNVFGFVKALALFVGSLGLIYWGFTKIADQAFNGLKEFVLLVTISSAILLLGSLAYKNIGLENVFGFVGALALFVVSLGFIYWRFTKIANTAFEGVKEFALLVGISGVIMILGATMNKSIKFTDILMFTGKLALFMGIMLLLFVAPKLIGKLLEKNKLLSGLKSNLSGSGDIFEDAIKGLWKFGALVVASGLVMLLASTIVKSIDFLQLIQFASTLALFIALVTLPFIFAKRQINMSMEGAIEFGALIAISSIILVMGGTLFTYFPQIIPGTVLFAIVLGTFMWGIGHAYKQFNSKKTWPNAIAATALVVISSILLLYAGNMIAKNKHLAWTTLLFAFVLGKFIKSISKAYNNIGKRGGIAKILVNAFALAFITVVTGSMLLYAGKTITDNQTEWWAIPVFAGTLFLYIMGMTLALKALNKIRTDLTKGIIAIGLLSIVTIFAAYAISIAADMGKKYSWDDIGLGILKLIGGLVFIGLAYMGLGYATFLDAGVGLGLATIAITTISALTVLSSYAFEKIVESNKKVKPKDIQEYGNSLKVFGELGGMMVEAFSGWWVLKLPMAAIAVTSLSIMLSSISQSVQEYASLKVPEYSGTKIVRYRQLKQSDFKQAGVNVRSIVTILSRAVMAAYDANPELFEVDWLGRSKFAIVSKSLGKLGPMIASIAKGVQSYANMLIGKDYQKDPKTGFLRPTKYEKLDKPDFTNAANNVKEIITILGAAVMSAYDAKPELFEVDWLGRSKFAKVSKALGKLGPMISSIAKGVQKYANLIYPIYEGTPRYDKDGNILPNRYEVLKDQNFKDVTKNVSLILSSLGGAIIQAYDAHPEYYDHNLFRDSKFEMTINANIKLASLISKIGKAVAEMANLNIATEWYTSGEHIGKPKKLEPISNQHFKNAAKNIMAILVTLGKPIQEIAKDPKQMELYEEADGWFSSGTSKFAKVINGNIKLAELISKIGKAVEKMANFQIATEWYTSGENIGKPKKYERMTKKHFTDAAKNVNEILTVLGQPIKNIARNKEKFEIYADIEDSSFFGMIKSKSPSKFVQVITANLKLADLISKISDSVKSYADLRIPTGYDKDGKPTGYERMTQTHFTDAANSIEAIISTIGGAIIETYNDHESWFNDGEDSDFAKACAAIGTMGNMISQIAEGVSNYAQLRIPNWSLGTNQDGTPKGYFELNRDTFEKSGDTIEAIITNYADAIIRAYNKLNKENWFDDGENSKFNKVCTSMTQIGELVASISEGIKAYADIRIPIFDKNGNPSSFIELNDDYFAKASKNIATVITIIYSTLANIYKGKFVDPITNKEFDSMKGVNKELIKELLTGGDQSPLMNMMNAFVMMGDVISSIAGGIAQFVEMNFKGKNTEEINLDHEKIKKATENIGEVLTAIGTSLVDTITRNERIFGQKSKLEKILFGSSNINENDIPALVAAKTISMLSKPIVDIAGVLKVYANGEYTDADGKTVGKFSLKDAKTNIRETIGIIGETLYNEIETKSYKKIYTKEYQDKINIFTSVVTQTTSSISQIISSLSPVINSLGQEVSYKKGNERLIDIIQMDKNDDYSLEKVFSRLLDIIASIRNNLNSKFDDQTKTEMAIANSVLNDISHFATESTNMISNFVNETLAIFEVLDNIDLKSFDTKIDSLVNTYVKVINKLKGLINKENSDKSTGEKIVNSLIGVANNQTDEIKLFTDSLKGIVNLSIYASTNINEEGYKKLGDEVKYLGESINSLNDNGRFESHASTMEKYVTTVNKIDVTKVDKLIKMVESMNNLSEKFDGVDGLTKTIAEDLAVVLDKLVRELTFAKDYIDKADKLQKDRQEIIRKQINEVKKIMEQKLTIEINRVDDLSNLEDKHSTGSSLFSGFGPGNNDGQSKNNGSSTPSPTPDGGNINIGGSLNNMSNKQPQSNNQSFFNKTKSMTPEELFERLKNEIPKRFKIDKSGNYINAIS